jgi:hypothetical protein
VGQTLQQLSPGAPLVPLASVEPPPPPPADDTQLLTLQVVACAPGPWDRVEPTAWPRTPGNIVIGSDADGTLHLCGGFLPCGNCAACQTGAHLACSEPTRPGWNVGGGLAQQALLPRRFLAPAPELAGEPQRLAGVAALLAAGGTTYQAIASAGMAPGDTVLVHGPAGPGALPLRVMVACGLRPLWIAQDPACLPADLRETVVTAPDCPPPDNRPSPRSHLLDLAPTRASVAAWRVEATSCLTLTLLGPGPLPDLDDPGALLGGQAALRWIRDLHPHLVPELAALAHSGRVTVQPWLEAHGLETFPASHAAFVEGSAPAWPVLTP